MGMEIKINAGDMLKVLVNSGMDATDAKAIIFDLLQYPEGNNMPERRKLKDAKKQRMKKRKEIMEEEENDDSDDEDGDSDDEEDEEEEEVDNEESDDLLATKIRRPKRINFKNFGGPAQSIQPKRNN